MKFILGIIVGIVMIIFVVQNTDVMDLDFLSWTLRISEAIIILITFGFGIIIGIILRGLGRRRR